jgi:hypothetical protein
MTFHKTVVTAAVLASFLFVGSVVPSRADDHDRCERRIRKAEQNLDKEVRKHGEHSRQAEQRRRELEQARSTCHVDDRDHHDHP